MRLRGGDAQLREVATLPAPSPRSSSWRRRIYISAQIAVVVGIAIQRAETLGQGQVVGATFQVSLHPYAFDATVEQRHVEHTVDLHRVEVGIALAQGEQGVDGGGPIVRQQGALSLCIQLVPAAGSQG